MPSSRRPMSKEHKAALAEGREQGRKVAAYLEALENSAPKRGRRRTPESIAKRLEALPADIAAASPIRRLELIQERKNLEAEQASLQSNGAADIDALRGDFVKVAKGYAERKGLSYAAFREVGVPADALKDAGISRAS